MEMNVSLVAIKDKAETIIPSASCSSLARL
jgi:hypothetical protein